MICSDGLWSVVEEHDVERITRAGAAAELCRRLVEEAATRRGTPDNLTVGIFRMHAGRGDGGAAARMARSGWRRFLASGGGERRFCADDLARRRRRIAGAPGRRRIARGAARW